jgi:hypothetical protein
VCFHIAGYEPEIQSVNCFFCLEKSDAHLLGHKKLGRIDGCNLWMDVYDRMVFWWLNPWYPLNHQRQGFEFKVVAREAIAIGDVSSNTPSAKVSTRTRTAPMTPPHGHHPKIEKTANVFHHHHHHHNSIKTPKNIMAPPTVLAIKTSSVIRLVKEEAMYHKELVVEQQRLAKMSEDSETDEYALKQQVYWSPTPPSTSLTYRLNSKKSSKRPRLSFRRFARSYKPLLKSLRTGL